MVRKLTQICKRGPSGKLTVLISAIFAIGFFCLSLPGGMHSENVIFLLNYLNPFRSVGAKIFDPVLNDWTLYQGRELSYFFDYLDACFIEQTILWGHSSFHSITKLLGVILLIALQQWGLRRYFRHHSNYWYCFWSLIFLLSPGILDFYYFRSAKLLTAIGITASFFLIAELQLQPGNRKLPLLLGGILFLTGLCDRQGAFAGAALAVATAFSALLTGREYLRQAAAAGLTAAALNAVYVMLAAPLLIRMLTGSLPEFSYLQMSPPALTLTAACGGILSFFSAINVVFLPQAWLSIMVWSLTAYLFRRSKKRLTLFLTGSAAAFACWFGMYLKHPAIGLQQVLSGGYYTLPFAALFLLTAAAAVHHIRKYGNVLCAAGVLILAVKTVCFVQAQTLPSPVDETGTPYRQIKTVLDGTCREKLKMHRDTFMICRYYRVIRSRANEEQLRRFWESRDRILRKNILRLQHSPERKSGKPW